MKKVLSILVFCFCIYFTAVPQCTPNAATGTPGLSPAPSAVACIERGVFYDFTLYFENFSSFSCSGFSVNVTSATIDNLSNLPCGITWQANKTTFAPGETGCIRISGTTTDAVGQYALTVNMTFVLNILGSSYPVSGTLQDLIQQMQGVGCSPPSVNIDYYSRVVDQGTLCPAIGTLPNSTSSGATCPSSSPTISISGNDTICAGTSTMLTANVTNGSGTVTYSWSPGGGSTQSITIIPTSTTTYSVTATASNGSATATSTVTVNQRPNAAFTATPFGTSASVTNTTTGASSYSWNFGDGQTSTAQNPPAHTYSSNGTYTITLITTNTCGTDTATQQVIISGGSGPSVTISGNTTICSGDSTTLTANATNTTGTVTYSWSSGGSTQTITVNPTSTATYSVTVTDQNGSASATSTVTVNQVPNAAFTATPSGTTVSVSNTTTGASSYSWNFGDGQTSSVQNPPAHTYSSGGTYTITLVATNSCGNDTTTHQVTVVTGNGPAVSISGDTTVCYRAHVTLIAHATNTAGSVTYAWSPGGGSGPTKSVNPTTTTTYSVTVTAQNGTTTASATVTVDPRPNIAFTVATTSATISITNTTTDASSYSWNFGDGQVSTEQNPSHTYLSNGTFTMRLIATNSCGNDTSLQQVTIVAAGIGSIANSFGLKIYPNPFNSSATIEVENMIGTFDFAIYSITGMKILQQKGMNESKFIIQKDALLAEVYFIEVRGEKVFGREKMVVY